MPGFVWFNGMEVNYGEERRGEVICFGWKGGKAMFLVGSNGEGCIDQKNGEEGVSVKLTIKLFNYYSFVLFLPILLFFCYILVIYYHSSLSY